jgi:hypothetical protein
MMCVFCLSGTFFDDGNHQVIFIKVVEVAGSGMCSKYHGSGVLCSTTLSAPSVRSGGAWQAPQTSENQLKTVEGVRALDAGY